MSKKRGLVTGEGIKIRAINISRKIVECPTCKTESKRHSLGHRWLRDIGLSAPVILEITYSKHYCPKCVKHFNLSMLSMAPERSNFTNRAVDTVVGLVRQQHYTLSKATEHMEKKFHVHIPASTIHDLVAMSVAADVSKLPPIKLPGT